VTFEVAYPQVSILRAVVVPPYGGDTVWANTVAAYDEPPGRPEGAGRPAARGAWQRLRLRRLACSPHLADEGVKRYREVFTRRLIEAEHPVVRVHPETGERSARAGPFRQAFGRPFDA
jgi:alpha-ketoglutarate-dependent taurine dioxygenase